MHAVSFTDKELGALTAVHAFAYIETLDPTTICTNFGACLPGQLFARNASVPPLPPALVAKAAALRQRAFELSASNDFCDTCKVVITEAATILGNLVRTWQQPCLLATFTVCTSLVMPAFSLLIDVLSCCCVRAGHPEADPAVRQGGLPDAGPQLPGPVPELCGAVWAPGHQHGRAGAAQVHLLTRYPD